MSLVDNVFDKNFSYVNKITFRILFFANITTIVIFILTLLHVFSVDLRYCLFLFGYSCVCTIVSNFLHLLKKRKYLTSIFNLLGLEGFIVFAGSNIYIGIYMTFGLIPILATLYYNKRITIVIDICSYLLMLLALYFKYLNGASLFINLEGNTGIMATYFPVVMGFTIEYTVIFFVSILLTSRNYSLLNDMNSTLDKLRDSNEEINTKNVQLEDTQLKIIAFVAECLGSHDLFTGNHVIHTKEYVTMICNKLKELGFYTEELTDKNISLFTSAAFLHDIGKIHIPEGILNKIGKFTDEEFERMKSHPAEGKRLLEFLPKIGDGKFNVIAIQMAFCHHEKWNGTGYPQKISGFDIPLCARIMACADVLDALISKRLYKEPMSIDEAMKIFEESKGTHFEPCIADAVIACKDEIQKIDEYFKKKEAESNVIEQQWWASYHQKLENHNNR